MQESAAPTGRAVETAGATFPRPACEGVMVLLNGAAEDDDHDPRGDILALLYAEADAR